MSGHVQGWLEYLKYGVPAAAMMCLEWWLFEIANMLSGLLPDAEASLAVGGVCVQIVSLAFMVPLGVSIGLRIRVSHLLGALPLQLLSQRSSVFAVSKQSYVPAVSRQSFASDFDGSIPHVAGMHVAQIKTWSKHN